jgi:hypothetical protein
VGITRPRKQTPDRAIANRARWLNSAPSQVPGVVCGKRTGTEGGAMNARRSAARTVPLRCPGAGGDAARERDLADALKRVSQYVAKRASEKPKVRPL